jgi:glutathione synthase/RimK-type ligase-like ATP-grasp enzyme
MADTVLITGARAIAALDIARDFKRLGYRVLMADSTGGSAAHLSRYVDSVYKIASPRHDFAGFSRHVADLVDTLRPRLLIPTCEEVFHLARLEDGHPARAILFAPPLKVLRQLHDKAAFAALCVTLNVPVPQTYLLTARADLARFVGATRHWVFKPCFSRFGTQTLVGPAPDELAAINPSSYDPWIAQRKIVGQEMCFQAIAHSGKISAFVAYRGTWRLKSGASLGFEALSAQASQSILNIAARLADGLALTGQFACDLIVDHDNQIWLIECNPRATSGVHLWPQDGRLARAYLGDGQVLLQPSTQPARYLGPAMATLAFGDALTSCRMGSWWEVMRDGRDVVGIQGDRLPVLGAFVDGLAFMAQGALRGISATAATTLDIEWNGEPHDQPTP